MTHTLKNKDRFTLRYRGFMITVTQFESSECGTFHVATNNLLLSRTKYRAFRKAETAIKWDKQDIDRALMNPRDLCFLNKETGKGDRS